ncbi:hypothetical protein CAI21_07745 [Alkalilimnicola ehrlichii]|nr:hypothetical protein [Alkalilimnicola ehrlichii]RFA30086.1 hypothetical protein CAI21_07745 [Alkalilimnicola ehrlichii]
MAILGLISAHPGTNRGGTAVSIVRLANYFAAQGILVEVLTRRKDLRDTSPEPVDPTVNIHVLRSRKN